MECLNIIEQYLLNDDLNNPEVSVKDYWLGKPNPNNYTQYVYITDSAILIKKRLLNFLKQYINKIVIYNKPYKFIILQS